MYKEKLKAQSIYSLVSEIKKNDLQSIYFLFGEDHFTITNAIKVIEKKIDPFISSDFDKETINADKKENLNNLIDLAYTYPFGSEKKLLIVKSFENYANKKILLNYINDPAESTILVIVNNSKITNLNPEPYKTLLNKNYIFEARELKGRELENWTKKRCTQLGFDISPESVKTLIEIVGEDKSLIEMQLQKFQSYLSDKKEITIEEIKKMSSATKEYSIFDLLNSIGKGNASISLKVITNLLDHGKDLVFIVSMLTKYFSVIAQSVELKQRNLSDFDAAKEIGVSKYYYMNCKNTMFFKNDSRIINACKTLYKTDLALKTTNADQKTLSTIMLAEIFSD